MEIRQATLDDVEPLVDTKVAAFLNDPVERWLFPNNKTRPASLRRAFTHGMKRQVARGATWCTNDRLALVTWGRPDEPQVGTMRSLLGQLALAPLIFRFGPPLRTALNASGSFTRHRPKGPHWLLASVATHPNARGQGLATALIRSGLINCDRSALQCFLFSNNVVNNGFFERFGFQAVDEFKLPASGPVITTMLRPPANEGGSITN